MASADAQAIIDAINAQAGLLNSINSTIQNTANTGGGISGGASRADRSFNFIATSGGELAQKLVRYGQQSDAGMTRFSLGLNSFQRSIADGTRGFNNTLKTSGARFADQLVSGELTAQEFNSSIRDNIKSLRDMRNAGQITTEQFRDYRSQLYALQSTTMATVKATETVGKAFSGFTSVIDGAGKVASAIQSGGDGIGASAKIAQMGMSGLASGAEKVGGLLKSLGPLVAMAPGLGKLIGGGLTIFGAVVEQFGAGAKAVIEKSFPILEAQTTRLYNAFQTASSAGAMFGNGLTGITQASLDAGMGTVEFTKILKDNSADLANAVGGVTGGARTIAKASKEMELSGVRQELANFGISVGEQNSLLAQTMGTMRRTGRAFDTETLAKTTAQYAKDLKLIADITGEDAKTREKAAAEASNTLQFQMELNKLAPDQKKQVEASIAAMGPENAKLVREMMISGGQLISEETNTIAALMPSVADQARALYNNIQTGNTSTEAVFTTIASFSDRIKSETAKLGTDTALALQLGVNDQLSKAAASGLALYNDAIKITPETVQTVLTEFKKIKNETDPATTSITQMALQSQKFAALLDEKTLPVIGKFASLVAEFNGKIIQALAEFDRMMAARTGAPPPALPPAAQIQQNLADDQRERQDRERRRAERERAEATGAPKPKSAISEAWDDFLGRKPTNVPAVNPSNSSPDKLAYGGVVNYPKSGQLAELHGTEAVLPLENTEAMAKIRTSLFGDGNTTVDKNSRDMVAAMAVMYDFGTSVQTSIKDQTAGIKTEQTAMMETMLRPNMQSQDRMLEMMNSRFEEMISLLRDVSNHTEMTSARVA